MFDSFFGLATNTLNVRNNNIQYILVLTPIRSQTQCNKIELYLGSSCLFVSDLVSAWLLIMQVYNKEYKCRFLPDIMLLT